MWQAPRTGFAFRPLREMCQAWVAEFSQRLATVPADAPARSTQVWRGRVRSCFATSPRLSERDVLLCTDLHAGNVLAAQREPWLVIDPKPYLGDPCYDVLQHLINCEERLAEDPAGLAQRMADLCGLDGDGVRQWLLARCVIDGLQDPMLRAIATALAPT